MYTANRCWSTIAMDVQQPTRQAGKGRSRNSRPAAAPSSRVALTLRLEPAVIQRCNLHALDSGRRASDLVGELVVTHLRAVSLHRRGAQAEGSAPGLAIHPLAEAG